MNIPSVVACGPMFTAQDLIFLFSIFLAGPITGLIFLGHAIRMLWTGNPLRGVCSFGLSSFCVLPIPMIYFFDNFSASAVVSVVGFLLAPVVWWLVRKKEFVRV